MNNYCPACGCLPTGQMRGGPDGLQTLCNKCGSLYDIVSPDSFQPRSDILTGTPTLTRPAQGLRIEVSHTGREEPVRTIYAPRLGAGLGLHDSRHGVLSVGHVAGHTDIVEEFAARFAATNVRTTPESSSPPEMLLPQACGTSRGSHHSNALDEAQSSPCVEKLCCFDRRGSNLPLHQGPGGRCALYCRCQDLYHRVEFHIFRNTTGTVTVLMSATRVHHLDFFDRSNPEDVQDVVVEEVTEEEDGTRLQSANVSRLLSVTKPLPSIVQSLSQTPQSLLPMLTAPFISLPITMSTPLHQSSSVQDTLVHPACHGGSDEEVLEDSDVEVARVRTGILNTKRRLPLPAEVRCVRVRRAIRDTSNTTFNNKDQSSGGEVSATAHLAQEVSEPHETAGMPELSLQTPTLQSPELHAVLSQIASGAGPSMCAKVCYEARKKQDLRRFVVANGLSFKQFREELVTRFGIKRAVQIQYRDNEGDTLHLSSDEEMLEVYRVAQKHDLDPVSFTMTPTRAPRKIKDRRD